MAGYANSAQYSDIWFTWWLGDVGGQLLVAPVVVLWTKSNVLEFGRKDLQRLARLMAVTIAVGLVAFSPLFEQTARRGAFAVLAVVPLLWAALRHNQRDTATATFLLSFFCIWGTLANGGPFARPSLNDSFLLVLAFVISTAVPSLVLSADVAVRKEAQVRQELLVRELQHRTKNLLAVVQSISARTLTSGRSVEETKQALEGRLRALASAHGAFFDAGHSGADLREIVNAEVAAFSERLSVQGPGVRLAPQAAQMFALLVHELATNATKHGALSNPQGRVAVAWWLERDSTPYLHFRWHERDGPTVTAPQRIGFGRTIIEELVSQEFAATPHIEYAPEGLRYELKVEEPRLQKQS
jgi:two-component sensor histidine kinase